MPDIYDEFAEMAREMLSPTSSGGLGQGRIELKRYPQDRDSLEPWTPVDSNDSPVEREVLRAAASVIRSRFNSSSGYSGETAILEGDIRIVAAVPSIEWTLSDKSPLYVSIDNGPDMPVVLSSSIPEAGTPVAIELIVRGPKK